MATESVIVELDADVVKYLAKMAKANKTNDKLSKSVKLVGAAIKKSAQVMTGAAVALTAFAVAASKSQKELKILSEQAKVSTEDFQAIAFATSTAGINAEQFADISKDLSDKLGEFSVVATGAFQDVVDVMGISTQEGQQLAKELQNLSSVEVLGTLVSRMEEAGATANEMTFALESMGNDLSRLTGLFTNNSSQLESLISKYKEVNDVFDLTSDQVNDLAELGVSYELLFSTLKESGTYIVAELAPAITAFFDDIIAAAPDAAQSIINFVNSFSDPENISSMDGVRVQIAETNDMLFIMTNKLDRLTEDSLLNSAFDKTDQIDEANTKIAELNERLVELNAQRAILSAPSDELPDLFTVPIPEFQDDEAKLQEYLNLYGELLSQFNEDRFNAEGERLSALDDALLDELELHQKMLDAKLISQREYDEKVADSSKKFGKAKKEEEKIQKASDAKKADSLAKFAAAGQAVNQAFFDDNKAVAAGLIVADTASAIMKSLSVNPYDYFNVGIIAATGAAQLSNALSASKGGGSTSSSSGGGGNQQPAQQADFEQETDSLELTESSIGGSSTQRIEFATDSGDELIDAIAAALNNGQRKGQFS